MHFLIGVCAIAFATVIATYLVAVVAVEVHARRR
jgi:hypothetical protein